MTTHTPRAATTMREASPSPTVYAYPDSPAMNFLSNPWQPIPDSAQVSSPPRRISTAAGERLSAIVSDKSTTPASSPRPATVGSTSTQGRSDNRWSSLSGTVVGTGIAGRALPRSSRETMPPAKMMGTAERLPDDEKPPTREFRMGQRGGWKRLAALVLVACLAIGLGVGLGVGLSKRKHSHDSAQTPAVTNDNTTDLAFPVGEYSLNTALRDVQTNCSSKAAAWRCYPYSTYAESPSASITTFNWILKNTSSTYATNSTSVTTDSAGIPANISVSSSDDPFSITFDSMPLTYINNDTDPRYFFTYTMSTKVIPSTSITSDNRATACFFNQTQLIGTLHLSDSIVEDYPSTNASTSYTSWPFAVHIELVSPGGQDIPACYYTSDGVIGERVTNITTESTDDLCTCDYRNFS